MTTLLVDDLSLEVRWSSRRKTLGLSVERDATLVIRAPRGTRLPVLERFVRQKRGWLLRKQAERKLLMAQVVNRQYVSGEVFAYLGRDYRLLLVEEQEVALKLEGELFLLRRSEAARARELFVSWYVEQATPWITGRTAALAAGMGVRPSKVIVRDLGHRWGSCTSASGRIRIHWAMILMPPDIVEYVLVHELAHLLQANHSAAFWQVVERALPDYRRRKQWLTEHGAERSVL